MLRIEGLSKTYPGGTRALWDVSLEIPEGVFGLLGPNGAGKTTLMRTLATLQEADAGSVHLDDLDVSADPEGLRRRLSYLPQEFGVYPRETPESMLHHLAVLKGLTDPGSRRAAVDDALERTHLHPVRRKRLGTFSRGMRQRFGIAQALLGRPRLMIVDEPTAGLDPEERRRFLDLFGELAEEVVVILSTHIVEDVAEVCTRMAILGEGRVLRRGEPAALTGELAGRVWRRLLDREEVAAWPGDPRTLSRRLRGGRTEVRLLHDEPPGPGCEPAAPELIDVYFAALQESREAH